MTTGVRLARTSDLDAMAAVQVNAWRASYGDLLPRDVLDSLNEGDIALDWTRALLLPGDHRLLVALANEEVVGAAAIGPVADAPAGVTGEITLFVISPHAWGRGHGSRLLQSCADHLVAGGFFDAEMWIPLEDEALRKFLLSAGWGPDGAYRDLEVGPDTTLRQVRMVTALTDEPARAT